jgi:hypothetical protein
MTSAGARLVMIASQAKAARTFFDSHEAIATEIEKRNHLETVEFLLKVIECTMDQRSLATIT